MPLPYQLVMKVLLRMETLLSSLSVKIPSPSSSNPPQSTPPVEERDHPVQGEVAVAFQAQAASVIVPGSHVVDGDVVVAGVNLNPVPTIVPGDRVGERDSSVRVLCRFRSTRYP